MSKSTEELMLAKLEQLVRVLTLSVIKGLRQGEQIALLDNAGFPPKEIAEFLGTTRNTVSVALTTLRKVRSTAAKTRKTTRTKKR
jgi:hypothetical protein